MHGIVFTGLKDVVTEEHGADAWRAIQGAADVERRLYVPAAECPDEHLTELVGAALEVTGAGRCEIVVRRDRARADAAASATVDD